MKITYEDHMGSDLKTVNMARVSFNKRSAWLIKNDDFEVLNEKDEKLIDYLAKHKHWAPFAHNVVTVHVKAPIFVARQLFKHKVAFIESEVSRRYVDYEPEFYVPDTIRKRAANKKQGSGDNFKNPDYMLRMIEDTNNEAISRYNYAIKQDVCPEQARMLLPLNTYTEWFLTGSLPAYHRMYNLRVSDDAQKETCELVQQLDPIMNTHYPLSWGALKKYA